MVLITLTLSALAFGWVGLRCVLNPAAVQSYVLRAQSNRWACKINPFSHWMKTPSYRSFLRFMGLVFVVFAALEATVLVSVLYLQICPGIKALR
jgi:hypothetical protein